MSFVFCTRIRLMKSFIFWWRIRLMMPSICWARTKLVTSLIFQTMTKWVKTFIFCTRIRLALAFDTRNHNEIMMYLIYRTKFVMSLICITGVRLVMSSIFWKTTQCDFYLFSTTTKLLMSLISWARPKLVICLIFKRRFVYTLNKTKIDDVFHILEKNKIGNIFHNLDESKISDVFHISNKTGDVFDI